MLIIKKRHIEQLKVLHGPVVSLYQPYLYVKGLREMGIQADYMVHSFSGNEWLARSNDFDLHMDGNTGLQIEKSRELNFFNYALNHYDIFHFHSGFGLLNPTYSLYGRLSELSYIKKLGKKIVMSWWGCDLRTEKTDIVHKYSACNDCIPAVREFCKDPEKQIMTKRALKYVDLHLSNGDLAASYPFIKWLDNAVDCNEFKPLDLKEIPTQFRLPKTDKIRIYHSFGNSASRGDVKGTTEIMAAVDKLQNEGAPIELMFFDKIPNQQIKFYQAQADLVIDQLKAGWYGSTAVECLSMGKPVVTYVRPEVKKIVPQKYPLIEANPDNIYTVLKSIIANKKNLGQFGIESRKYALDYHHYKKVANDLVSKYYSL